jgi:hypothetical protein
MTVGLVLLYTHIFSSLTMPLSTLLTASSTVTQIPICQMMLGLNPGLLLHLYWQSVALTARLHLIHFKNPKKSPFKYITGTEKPMFTHHLPFLLVEQ